MAEQQPESWTETTTVSARSPRVVVIFEDGPRAVAPGQAANTLGCTFHRVLEWMGRVWGGNYMLAIPTVQGTIPNIFFRLAATYDPDLVLPWAVTMGEIELRDPDRGKRLAERAAEQYPAMPEVISDDVRRTSTKLVDIDPAHTDAFYTEFERFKSALNPFGAGTGPQVDAHHLQVVVPRPLTSRSAFSLNNMTFKLKVGGGFETGTHPISGPVTDFDLSAADPWLATLLKIKYGITGAPQSATEPRPATETAIYRTFDATNPITGVIAANRVFRDLEGRVGSHPDGGATNADLASSVSGSGTAWSESGALSSTPMSRSAFGLQELTYNASIRRPVLIVVGDSTADAALYQAWTRIYGDGTAAWVPTSVAHDVARGEPNALTEVVTEMVCDLPGPRYERGWVASFTIDHTTLEKFRDGFGLDHWNEDVRTRIRELEVVAHPDDIVLSAAPDFFRVTPESFATSRNIAFRDGVAQTPLVSPIPPFMTSSGMPVTTPLNGNWVADAIIGGTKLPTHPYASNAAEATGELTAEGDLRCGRTGTSWIAVGGAAVAHGVNVEHALNVFSPAAPSMARVLDAMLEPEWTWELSSAGRYYEGFATMCGGLEPLLEILTGEVSKPILEGFLNKKGPGFLLTEGKVMTLLDMHEVLRLDRATASEGAPTGQADHDRRTTGILVDSLVVRGILSPGLVLQCDRCRHTAFYPLPDVGRTFTCKRCSHPQLPLSTTWKPRAATPPTTAPGWFYRLDGLVQQALEHNIQGPALALHGLGAGGADTRYSWAINLIPKGQPWNEPLPEANEESKHSAVGGGAATAQADADLESSGQVEIDFVALVDGRLSLGEAKTSNVLGKNTKKTIASEIDKTSRAATLLSAERVVFATTRPNWLATTASAIAYSKKHSSREVVSLVDLDNRFYSPNPHE